MDGSLGQSVRISIRSFVSHFFISFDGSRKKRFFSMSHGRWPIAFHLVAWIHCPLCAFRIFIYFHFGNDGLSNRIRKVVRCHNTIESIFQLQLFLVFIFIFRLIHCRSAHHAFIFTNIDIKKIALRACLYCIHFWCSVRYLLSNKHQNEVWKKI